MHFKGTILDLYKSNKDFKGPALVYCSDDFYTKLIKDYLKEKDQGLVAQWGVSVDRSWIEETFLSLSLFSDQNSYFIYESKELSEDLIKKIFEYSSPVYFHFKKKPKYFKKFDSFEIVDFNFWEMNNFIDFVSIITSVEIPRNIRSFFSSWSLDDKTEVYNSLNQLMLRYDNLSELSGDDIQKELGGQGFNVFNLSQDVADKKMNVVIKKIHDLVELGSWSSIHSSLLFIRNLFIKSMDESYASNKAKLSQYDKKILQIQRSYSPKESSMILKEISSWEILAKRRDFNLKNILRLKLLSNIG